MDVDVIVLTNSDKPYAKKIAKRTILSMKDSELDVNFHIHLLESGTYFPEEFSNITDNYVKINESFNYNRYLNHALKYIKHEWVVICNNDVGFERSWFTEIMNVHKERPDIHSFSPKDPLLYMKYFDWHFLGTKGTYFESYKVSEALMGWCLVIKKESLDKIVPFDELFDMYYQDNDYCEMLKKHGIKHALCRYSIACHLQTLTMQKKIDESKERKQKIDEIKFRTKWNQPKK